ncbi:MAG: TIGR03790 family protein [Acidobacteriia bacterium]|nr:TIGR03790 family protein [Terriglobia bacterium]
MSRPGGAARVLGALAAFAGFAICPAQGPRNVMVILNRTSASSAAITSYYASKRGIPPANICSIQATTQETISRLQYDEEIERPIQDCLRSHAGPILYIATTLGLPLRIEGPGGRETTAASVDSELALLYARMRGHTIKLPGPAANPFYRQKDSRFDQRVFPMYLVTRLAAYDTATVKRMIDQSLAAANRGVFVLDQRDASDVDGNSWLLDAAILLPAHRVVLDQTTTVLKGHSDVIGYASWGTNDKNRKERFSGMHWLPGGIATGYVSTDGRTFLQPPATWTTGSWSDPSSKWWAGSPQSLTADFLMEGATGASGHVFEPFLSFTPRPDYLFPAYYSGRNLAESFYLAMPALSWMNIVAGDPLCSLGRP